MSSRKWKGLHHIEGRDEKYFDFRNGEINMKINTKVSIEDAINAAKDHEEAERIREEYRKAFERLDNFCDGFEIKKNKKLAIERVETGFKELDNVLGGGLPISSITGVSGSPSVGKSTFIMQMAEQMAEKDYKVFYFSYEMSDIQVGSSIIARNYFKNSGKNQDVSISSLSLINPKFWNDQENKLCMTDEQWDESIKIAAERKAIVNGHYFFRDCTLNPYTIDDIETEIANWRMVYGNKTPVVFIDYLHMIPGPMDEHGRPKLTTDKQILDYNMRGIRKIASKHGCPVVVISALRKEDFKSMADMTSLSGSSGIPYNCDIIISLQYGTVGDKNEKFNLEFEQNRNPRRIKATVIKNRFFIVGKEIKFDYYNKFNYFDDTANLAGWKDKTVESDVAVENGTKPLMEGMEIATIGNKGIEIKGQKAKKGNILDELKKDIEKIKKEEDIEV